MLYDKKRHRFFPYIEWTRKGYVKGSSFDYLPLGVYGIFYPDGVMNVNVDHEELFLRLCPLADDIWLKVMSLLENVECESIMQGSINMNEFVSIELNREQALARTNVDLSANDRQIQDVFKHFGLFKIFEDAKGN